MRTQPQHRAFTLIELLVVVAIIAILAGILLPALGKAKGRSRTIKCIAQTREVASALNQFAYDHKLFYPGARTDYASLDWADIGGEYVDATPVWGGDTPEEDRPLAAYIQTFNVFECPSDRGYHVDSIANVFDRAGNSYLYPRIDGESGDMGLLPVENEKLTDFDAVSKKVLLFEATFFQDADKDNSQTKWHSDKKASVLGFIDGHSALTETENYGAAPAPDEVPNRDYY